MARNKITFTFSVFLAERGAQDGNRSIQSFKGFLVTPPYIATLVSDSVALFGISFDRPFLVVDSDTVFETP